MAGTLRGWLLAGVLAVLPLYAPANEDPLAALASRLQAIDGLSGDFRQTLLSADAEPLERSRGEFRLLRPGYLSWHILDPDEQLLVAAGETLWHYDVELETATRRVIPAGNPTSPLTILGGELSLLESYYSVTRTTELSWTLVPTFEGAEFESVELAFADALPVRMTILDRLGRSTRIDLESVEVSPALSPADFEFSPPPGVDIYDNGP